jgi:hypothetical protein
MLRFWVAAICLLSVESVYAELTIKNIKAAHGLLGNVRDSLELYPSDDLFFRFELDGLTEVKPGQVEFEMQVKLRDADGKVVFEQKGTQKKDLGFKGPIPSFSYLAVGPNGKAGDYTFTTTIRDLQSNKEASFDRGITIRPLKFKGVAPRLYRDAEAKQPAPNRFTVGEMAYFRLRAIGMSREQQKIDVSMAVKLLDESGKSIQTRPIVVNAKLDNPTEVQKANYVNFSGSLYLSIPGKFMIAISLTDVATGNKDELLIPIEVFQP